jgi:hypothetical protein
VAVKWFTDILTGPDNETHEPANYIAIIGSIAGLAMQIHSYFIRHITFDLQAFGVGLGAIVATLGAAQRLRGDVRDRDEHH